MFDRKPAFLWDEQMDKIANQGRPQEERKCLCQLVFVLFSLIMFPPLVSTDTEALNSASSSVRHSTITHDTAMEMSFRLFILIKTLTPLSLFLYEPDFIWSLPQDSPCRKQEVRSAALPVFLSHDRAAHPGDLTVNSPPYVTLPPSVTLSL